MNENSSLSSAATDAAQTLHERAQRRRSFKAGIVSYANYSITVDCIIRDQSASGAKLAVEDEAFLPDSFALAIPVDGTIVDCTVKWRKGRMLGVNYTSVPRSDQRNARRQSVQTGDSVQGRTILRR